MNDITKLQAMPIRPKWLISRDAAAYIGVQPWTLCKWRQKKVGPPYIRKSYRTVFYTIEDLDKFMASHTRVEA